MKLAFHANPFVNPHTGAKIKIGGPKYKRLVREFDEPLRLYINLHDDMYKEVAMYLFYKDVVNLCITSKHIMSVMDTHFFRNKLIQEGLDRRNVLGKADIVEPHTPDTQYSNPYNLNTYHRVHEDLHYANKQVERVKKCGQDFPNRLILYFTNIDIMYNILRPYLHSYLNKSGRYGVEDIVTPFHIATMRLSGNWYNGYCLYICNYARGMALSVIREFLIPYDKIDDVLRQLYFHAPSRYYYFAHEVFYDNRFGMSQIKMVKKIERINGKFNKKELMKAIRNDQKKKREML